MSTTRNRPTRAPDLARGTQLLSGVQRHVVGAKVVGAQLLGGAAHLGHQAHREGTQRADDPQVHRRVTGAHLERPGIAVGHARIAVEDPQRRLAHGGCELGG
ncbi:Recombination protein RecR [Propionibacterium freudenreichii]|nr:Recombination protein RecR [Propionibacterium freudenreichii]